MEILDDYGGNWYTSIAVDSNDNPHISYCEVLSVDRYDLKYAFYDGYNWEIVTVDSEGRAGTDNSIILDSSDNPHISYWDSINMFLKYATFNGTTWRITTVDTSCNGHPSIAIDPDGFPHIAYKGDYRLKYASFNGTNWYTTIVDPTYGSGTSACLAFDKDGLPHIIYRNQTMFDKRLKHAYKDGGSWNIEIIDDEDTYSCSMVIGTDDCIHIARCYYTGIMRLGYIKYDGYEWTFEDVGSTGSFPSIDVDSSNNPYIACTVRYGSSGHRLFYVYRNGADWTYELVIETGTSGLYNSLVIDSFDDPHIACCGRQYIGIELITFYCVPKHDGNVVLNWTVNTTDNSAITGFNLYRKPVSEARKGVKGDEWTSVNAALITGENPYAYINTGVEPGVTYEYKLEAIVDGRAETLGTTTGAAGGQPAAFALYQSRPNPARGAAVIAFELPEDVDVTLAVYDLSGRRVATLADGLLPDGEHERVVSGLAPGVYIYRLDAGDFVATKKMVVIK